MVLSWRAPRRFPACVILSGALLGNHALARQHEGRTHPPVVRHPAHRITTTTTTRFPRHAASRAAAHDGKRIGRHAGLAGRADSLTHKAMRKRDAAKPRNDRDVALPLIISRRPGNIAWR